MQKKAFTMIELVFVIVILGILAGVALPKLVVSRDDAVVAKLRADIGAIRSGIAIRKSVMLMEGNTAGVTLGANFSNVVENQIRVSGGSSGWTSISPDSTSSTACIKQNRCATFTYNTTTSEFTCGGNDEVCGLLGEVSN